MLIDLKIEIIKLEDESYHILIEAEFPGNILGKLIIDTGASKTVIDADFAEQFTSQIEDVENQDSSGINAIITGAKIGTIPKINFGNLEIKDYKCLLLDLSHVNSLYKKYTNKHIAGLLGSDFLVNYEAVIDYGQKKISFNY